ncbi:MAG: RNA polymerase sigma factor [Candidatus Binatia bacterium]
MRTRTQPNRSRKTRRTTATQSSEVNLNSVDAAVRRALSEGHSALLQSLIRRLGRRDVAEEVLSAFYVRVLSRARDVRQPAALRGWLRQVLATTIADHYRQRAATSKIETDWAVLTMTSAMEETERILCTCFYKLLPTLRPDYAEVIQRVDLEGEPRKNVATDLGTTVNTLGVRLHRGRAALKRRLEQTCLTCPVHGFFDCHCEYAERVRDAVQHTRRTSTV